MQNAQPLTTKLILFILGIFLTSIIFMLSIQTLDTFGFWIALLAIIAIIYYGFTHCKKGSNRRIIIWGVSFTFALSVIAYIVTIILVKSNLNF